jgi:hypothetical protein
MCFYFVYVCFLVYVVESFLWIVICSPLVPVLGSILSFHHSIFSTNGSVTALRGAAGTKYYFYTIDICKHSCTGTCDTYAHAHALAHTHSLTLSFSLSLSHALFLSHTHTHTHTCAHSLSPSLSHSHTHSHSHSLTFCHFCLLSPPLSQKILLECYSLWVTEGRDWCWWKRSPVWSKV